MFGAESEELKVKRREKVEDGGLVKERVEVEEGGEIEND